MPEIKKKRAPAVDSNQRAWAQVYDDMNDVINSVNQKSAVESRNGASGLDGDIRLFKDVDKTKYFIEGKFNDGWAKRELLFSDLSNETQDESINYTATESYVKPDGTVPFTAKQSGVAPTNTTHLSTKGYTDVGRLVSVTKDSNNIIFGMTDAASNLTFSGFGSNAYTSTTIPTTFVSSLTNSPGGQTLIAASTGELYRLGGGDNITITTDSPPAPNTGETWVQIDCDINTSNFLTQTVPRASGIRTFDTDAYTDTQTYASGAYIVIDHDESNVTATFSTITLADNSTAPSVRLNASGFLASNHAASGVTNTRITNWDAAHGWGNHASQNYLKKLEDTAATSGSLPSGHQALIEDYGVSADTAKIYNVASANSNLTIEDAEDGSGNAYVKFTAVDQVTAINRIDQVYAEDEGDTTVTSQAAASGDDILTFKDTDDTTWTISGPTNNRIYASVDIDFPTMYTHPTSAGNKHIPTGGSSGKFLKYDSSGTAVWATPSYIANTNYYLNGITKNSNTLTFAVDGATDQTYTFGSNAFNSTSFVTNSIYLIEAYETDAVTTTATASGADKLRFIETDDIEWVISGPSTDVITITPTINFPTMYTHPTGAGNKHIPSGGSSGQFLKYSSSGTATWATPSYTTDTNYYLTGITKSSNTLTFAVSGATDPTYTFGSNAFNSTSFLSSGIYLIEAYETDAVTSTATASGADKLRFIESDDINWAISGPSTDVITITPTINFPTMYSHPTTAGNKHVPSGGASGNFLKYSSDGTAVWATPSYTTDTNYYLTGITKSSNTLTFAISGASDQTYEFGSNAFNSSSFLTNSVYIIEAYETDAVTTTATASGADKLRFIETDDINWAITGPTSDVITITPTINFPTMYTHPTTAGNKHIPSGGAAGKFLKYSSSGTAVWETPSYTTNTNYYLSGVAKSGTNVEFTVTGGTNLTFTDFGANAFNSTSFLTGIASTGTTDESATPPRVSLLDDSSTICVLEEGSGISIEASAIGGVGNTVKISSTVDTSGLLTNGIYLIEAYQDDAVTSTVTAVGADKLRFIETDDIEWVMSGPSTDVITITPTINFPTMYTHPTTAGNKHVPSGGSSGQFLKYSSSGTAVWATPSYTTNTNDNYYLTGVTKSSNTLTFAVSGASNPTYTFGSNAFNSTSFLTSHQDISGKANLSHADFSSISLNSHSFPAATGTSSNSWPGLIVGGTTRLVASAADLQVKGFVRICQHLIVHEDSTTNVLNQVGLTYANDNLTVWTGSGTGQANFHVPGDVIAYKSSDPRLKTNKEELENPLYNLSKIKGYRFEWLPEAKKHNSYNEGMDIGVMSNEVEKIYPELVQTRSSGYKAVDYEKLTAVLIAAVNDLTSKLIEKGVLDEELQSSKSCC